MSTTYLGLQTPPDGKNWGNAVNANMQTLDEAYGTLQTQIQNIEALNRQQGFFNIDPEENYILLSTARAVVKDENGETYIPLITSDTSGNPACDLFIAGKMDEVYSDIFIATKVYAGAAGQSVSFYLNGCAIENLTDNLNNTREYYSATISFENFEGDTEYYSIKLDLSNFGLPVDGKFTVTKTDLITLTNNRAFYNYAPINDKKGSSNIGGISLYSSFGDIYQGQLIIKYTEFGIVKFETSTSLANSVYVPTRELNNSTITFTRTPIENTAQKYYSTVNPWYVAGAVWESLGVKTDSNPCGWVYEYPYYTTYIPWHQPIYDKKVYAHNAQEQSIIFEFYTLGTDTASNPKKTPVVVDYDYVKIEDENNPLLKVRVVANSEIEIENFLMKAIYYTEEAKVALYSGANLTFLRGTTTSTSIDKISLEYPTPTNGDVYLNTTAKIWFIYINEDNSPKWEMFSFEDIDNRLSELEHVIDDTYGSIPSFIEWASPIISKLNGGVIGEENSYFDSVDSLWGEIIGLETVIRVSNHSAVRKLSTPFIIGNDSDALGSVEYPAIFDSGEFEGAKRIYQYRFSTDYSNEDYNKVIEGDLFIYEAEGAYKLLKVSNGDLVSVEQSLLKKVFCGQVFEDYTEVTELQDQNPEFYEILRSEGVIAFYEEQPYYWLWDTPVFSVTSYTICKNSYEYTDVNGNYYPKDALYCFDPDVSRFILIESGADGKVESLPNTLMLRDEDGFSDVLTPVIPWGQALDENQAHKVVNAETLNDWGFVLNQGCNDYTDSSIQSISSTIETLQTTVGSHTDSIEALQFAVSENTAVLDQLEGDVENLYYVVSDWERNITGTYTTRPTANGELDVYPEDTFPAVVQKVQGNTRFSKNLFDWASVIGEGKTSAGVTCTANNNTLTFRGTPTDTGAAWGRIRAPEWLEVGKTYLIYQTSGKDYNSGNPYVGITTVETPPAGNPTYSSTAAGNKKLTVQEGYTYSFSISAGNLVVGTPMTPITVSFMAVEGNTVLPYEDYAEGAINTTFGGIHSTTRNLMSKKDCVNGYQNTTTGAISANTSWYYNPNLLPCAPNATYYCTCELNGYRQWSICWYDKNKVIIGGQSKSTYTATDGMGLTAPEKAAYMRISFSKIIDGDARIDIEHPMFTTQMDNVTFVEHESDALTLTEPVELGQWDYIDMENQQLIRQTHSFAVADVEYGSYEGVTGFGSRGNYYVSFTFAGLPTVVRETLSKKNIISNYYEWGSVTTNANTRCIEYSSMSATGAGAPRFDFRDDDLIVWNDDGTPFAGATPNKGETIAAFKAKFAEIGLQITYKTGAETAEPISCPSSYTAYKGGTETIIGGSPATVTQKYLIRATSEEEFNNLANRISSNETDIDSLEGRVAQVETNLQTQISGLTFEQEGANIRLSSADGEELGSVPVLDEPKQGDPSPVSAGALWYVSFQSNSLKQNLAALGDDVSAMQADIGTLYAIVKDTVVAVDTVEDTFDTRKTAGGLDIVDGTLTTVRKVQGTTQAVDGVLVNSTFGGIRSTGKQLIPQFEAATVSGQPCYPTRALSLGKTYRIGANAAVLGGVKIAKTNSSSWTDAYGSDWSDSGAKNIWVFNTIKTNPIPLDDKYIFIILMDGDGTEHYATPEDIERYEIVIFEGATEDYKYSPYVENTLILPEPVELGQWDYIDVEKQQVVRQTYYIDCTTDSFSLGSSTNTSGITQFWVSFGNAPKVYDRQYSQKDIIPNHTYTVGQNSSSKWVFFGRTSTDSLAIFIRNDDVLAFYDDGTLNRTATNAAMRAHLIETGFQFACKPSEVQSTEPISCPTQYVAYEGGTETIISSKGDSVTVTQDYYVVAGG